MSRDVEHVRLGVAAPAETIEGVEAPGRALTLHQHGTRAANGETQLKPKAMSRRAARPSSWSLGIAVRRRRARRMARRMARRSPRAAARRIVARARRRFTLLPVQYYY